MKVIRNWKYKTMNRILSTVVECHESHQELKIQDNESYTEYWCSMSWKSSGTEHTRQWILYWVQDSLSCIFSSWWLSWHSTPVLSIRFIVLYVQFLMTFMTFYSSTQYKIHCLVFSVPDNFHDILHQYSVYDSLSCIFSSWWLSWHTTPVLCIRFIVLYFQFLMTFMTCYTSTQYKIHCLVLLSTGVECHESHQELKIQDNESYTEYWCRMSWKSSGTENTRQWILYWVLV
jgi:hypothetical protein